MPVIFLVMTDQDKPNCIITAYHIYGFAILEGESFNPPNNSLLTLLQY